MVSIVALGAVTVGINLNSSRAELQTLELLPGSFSKLSVNHMEEIRLKLEKKRGCLPKPRSGGSVGNTANLIARAGLSCGMIGIGGNDDFGKTFVSNCEKASLQFISELVDGAVTGYDFYLADEDEVRTIILTQGANALLSPERINSNIIQDAELILLDGSALSFGPESEAAMSHCIKLAEATGVPFVLTLASAKIVENYRSFFDTFGPKAQMVAGNLEQTARLVGLDTDSSLAQVKIELTKSSFHALVTLDEDGAFARLNNEEFLVPTQKANAFDSTGAGDAFLGAFLVARQKGFSIRQSLAIGNVVSGEVIQYESACLPLRVDIPQLLSKAMQMADKLDG